MDAVSLGFAWWRAALALAAVSPWLEGCGEQLVPRELGWLGLLPGPGLLPELGKDVRTA